MNKRKIYYIFLIFILVIFVTVPLSGCKKKNEDENTHSHTFNSTPFYEVVSVNGTKVARRWFECECGEDSSHEELENAIVVNPTNVQKALDGYVVLRNNKYIVTPKENHEVYVSLNNKIIVFDEGDYNQIIHLRPSIETSTIYDHNTDTIVEDAINNSKVYSYIRNFTNITFAGTNSASINNIFYIKTGRISDQDEFLKTNYIDPVKNSAEYGAYYAKISIQAISLERINFSGENGRFCVSYGDGSCTIDEISIQNCKFTTNTPSTSSNYSQYNASSYLVAWENDVFGTINYKNNTVSGHYQGLYTQNADIVNVVENNISNTMHNAVAIKSGSDNFTGTINILNNRISSTQDRAIRFGKCFSCQINIKNNVFIDAIDSDNELIKSDAITETTYTLQNNTYNNTLLQDISNNKTPLLVTIITN